jgi:nitroimidazol reductase NimA-like FMN-containing flavoprotein (pyridoxamine 5'-phosphate oxidase superfamily)
MTSSDARAAELEVLGPDECVRLLASHRVGRIAFAHGSWPLVLPVNYVYDEPNVIIRTGPGAILTSAPLTSVAFEIDESDPAGTWGWSVVVQGPAFDISDAGDSYSAQLRLAPVEPFAPGERHHWLKITAMNLSGRRFGPVRSARAAPARDTAPGALEELRRQECFDLLATQPVGRLALTQPDHAPLVVPVNFTLDGDDIVFRSDPGSKLRLAMGPVAFQADFVDWYHRTGWSVLATGVAHEVADAEIEHLDVEPWAPGDKRVWIRIVVDEVTGRRLDQVELPWPRDDRGYL